MFFSNTHWPQLTAPFYSILFETSIFQFNISKCSPIMPDEVREHLTIDQRPFLHPESLQILQIFSDYFLYVGIWYNPWCHASKKNSRTSSRNIGPQHQKYSSIFNCTHGVLVIPVFTKPILSVCCQKAICFVSSDHRSQCHLKFQSCLITEYGGVCFWQTMTNPPKQHVVM